MVHVLDWPQVGLFGHICSGTSVNLTCPRIFGVIPCNLDLSHGFRGPYFFPFSPKECSHPWIVCQRIQKSAYQCGDKGWDGEWIPTGCYSPKECSRPRVICPWKSGRFLGDRLLWIGHIASDLTCMAYPSGTGSFASGEVLISWWPRAALSNSIPHWLALISLTIHRSVICAKDGCSVSGI